MNFINLSNHPSSGWGEEQKQAAKQWGTIIDYPFPEVDAQSSTQNIKELAGTIVISVLKKNPSAIMCQGEMTLTYQLVKLFKEKGLTVLAACSERKISETILPDGTYQKKAVFQFVKFREY
mgnify:FL=1